MFTGKTIGVLGAGNMGQALLRGFLEAKLVQPVQIIASSLDTSALQRLETECGIRTTTDNHELVRDSDIILLGTKPYSVVPVLKELRSSLRPGQVLVSVAAGLRTEVIEAVLPEPMAVIRVMPNTPSLIGMGTNAFCPGRYVEPETLTMVERLLGAAGLAVQVSDEQMDSVTAISGSGPAYVFLFMEVFYKAAEDLGLSPEHAQELVNQTMRGAVELAIASKDSAAELRRKVTSPGGVTAEAIATFESEGFRTMFRNAVQAGHDRSAEMTRECDSGTTNE